MDISAIDTCNLSRHYCAALACVLFCLLAKQYVSAHQSTNQNMSSQPQLTVSQESVIRVHMMELKRFKRLQECVQGTGKGRGGLEWMKALLEGQAMLLGELFLLNAPSTVNTDILQVSGSQSWCFMIKGRKEGRKTDIKFPQHTIFSFHFQQLT